MSRRVGLFGGFGAVTAGAVRLLAAATVALHTTDARAAPRLQPVEVEHGAVDVDGVLDEPVWHTPPLAVGLVEAVPVPGEPDRGTEAWIAYDDRTMYVAFHARVDPGREQSNALSPRDRNRGEDTVGLLLDTFRDGRRAYLFMVNSRGVQGDAIFVDGESGLLFQADMSWDSVFTSAATFSEGEYVVEIGIPLRGLRFPKADAQSWGIVLLQHVPVPFSVYTWPPIDPDAAGVLTQAAELGPFPVSARQGRIELLPTLTGFANVGEPPEGEPPYGVDPGFGARIGLSSAVTAEVTVNPDFSQIESDAGQVSANVKFPLFFPERRPFFLENADLLQTPITLVHTRSIVDPLGGYKVTGRAGKGAFAWLGAYDQHPAASTIFVDYASGAPLPTWSPDLVANADAIDHIARVRADFGGGNSLGGLVTDKELLVIDPAGGIAAYGNRVAAVDGVTNRGRYTLAAQVAGSSFDAPTADGGVTALSGAAWRASMHRQGERWELDLAHAYVAPGFRAEDGFVTEVGRMGFAATSTWPIRPTGVVRYVGPVANADLSLTPDGAIADGTAGPELHVSTDRWDLATSASYVRTRFLSTDFDLWSVGTTASVKPAPAWFVGVDAELGTLPHYAAVNRADLYRGMHLFVGPNTNADVFGRLNVDARVIFDTFGPTLGDPSYVTVIGRTACQLAVSRLVWVRWIEQVDTFGKRLDTSLLGALVVNYGTTVYAGYTESVPVGADRDLGAPPLRSVFLKLGWLGRL